VVTGDALVVGALAHNALHLGRQDDLPTPAAFFQGLTHDALAFPGIVHIRRIDKIDPSIQCMVDDTDRFLFAGWTAEIHRAQAQRRYFDPGASKITQFHPDLQIPSKLSSANHILVETHFQVLTWV